MSQLILEHKIKDEILKAKKPNSLWRLIVWFFLCLCQKWFSTTYFFKKQYCLPPKTPDNKLGTNTLFGLYSFIHYCKQLPPHPIALANPGKRIDVSIIIPVYNQWNYTRACINSILEVCDDRIQYELILADDCSTDETIFARQYFPGLIISKTDKNVGFLRNCNHAAKKAQGRYILLLNNDTIVLPNWLKSLYDTLELNSNAAIAGSKMLHANGAIQEAGVSLLPDGTISIIGNQYARYTPAFNIQREVHYVSGCSILVRKSYWDSVGGFDEHYQGAYYEDSDLAMAAWAKGMSVIYQPESEIIHFKHKTYSLKRKRTALATSNRSLFLKKWSLEARQKV